MKVKARVIKEFKNKYSKKKHKKDEVIEITKERFKEINSTKHGVLIKEIKEKNKKAPPKPTPPPTKLSR